MRFESKISELENLYKSQGKHSNYQIIPKILQKKLNINFNLVGKYEYERLYYMLSKVNISNKNILEIGGNIGFFAIEFLQRGALHIDFFEGNKEHAKFLEIATEILGFNNKINIFNQYFNFEKIQLKKSYDIIILLNVLHHIGDDFDDKKLSKEKALKKIGNYLRKFSYKTKYLIFQMGFNWKGDIKKPLFKFGTKREMIDFVKKETKNHFTISHIGIAEKINNKIIYNDLNFNNIDRIDSLGEFLNRPIFIMKSIFEENNDKLNRKSN